MNASNRFGQPDISPLSNNEDISTVAIAKDGTLQKNTLFKKAAIPQSTDRPDINRVVCDICGKTYAHVWN